MTQAGKTERAGLLSLGKTRHVFRAVAKRKT